MLRFSNQNSATEKLSILYGALANECELKVKEALNEVQTELINIDKDKFSLLSERILNQFYYSVAITAKLNEIIALRNKHFVEKSKLHRSRFDKDIILNRFAKLGLIGRNEMALVVAARQLTKKTENTCFVLSLDDVAEFNKFVRELITGSTTADVHRLQFIFMSSDHAIFSEIMLDKTTAPPTLKYFHCDPALTIVYADDIIRDQDVHELVGIARIEIYDSAQLLQKGLGCTYFSLEGAAMLATQMQYDDNYAYMRKHGIKIVADHYIYFKSSLSPRLTRASHLIEDHESFIRFGVNFFTNAKSNFKFKGLKSSLQDTVVANTVINKKGETFRESICKNLVKNDNDKIKNLRLNKKRECYKMKVAELLKQIHSSDDLDRVINAYGLGGMNAYLEKHRKAAAVRLNRI